MIGWLHGAGPAWLARWGSALSVGAAFVVLLSLEWLRPLRAARESRLRRQGRNLAMAGLSGLAIQLAQRPLTGPLTEWVESSGWGLLHLFSLPLWIELAFAVVFLDYTLWIWHVLTHKVPLLWRFHQVHHVDLDLDTSTALRFHFGEMLLSVPWRAAQIVVIGAGPLALALWQTVTLVAILFHHSNVRLPLALERWLCVVIVTPRMHGIHHSIVRAETDSNWSTIFTWPDRLHGTLRLNVPQQEITIGVPAYQDPAELGLADILRMPAAKRRSWQLADGRIPGRPPLPGRPSVLAA